MCAMWAWSATDSLVHSVVVQHHYCPEHGTVEDSSASTAIDASASGDLAISGSEGVAADHGDEAHDSCAHSATIRKQCSALVPPATPTLLPPTLFVVSSLDGRHLEAFRPRGPPQYRIAPKTSPPQSA